MSFSQEIILGIVSAFKMTSPPLYRYPYRNSFEAFRSDWKRIGGDIEAAFESFDGAGSGKHAEGGHDE